MDTASSSSTHQINSGIQAEVLRTLAKISPTEVSGFRKIRVGGVGDGGYVMLDDLQDIGVCYSLGVGPDVSWDVEMAEHGAHIFQYDHTVASPPTSHPRCMHFKVGIAGDDTTTPSMRRIDTLMRENGHAERNDMVLKIDIEGSEWEALSVLTSEILSQFKQILVEFHGMRLLNIESFRQRAASLFGKFRVTHQCIHVHGNNFGGMAIVEGIGIPDVLELTLVRKADYTFGPSNEVFPTYLDGPNNVSMPDLFLGSFRFQ